MFCNKEKISQQPRLPKVETLARQLEELTTKDRSPKELSRIPLQPCQVQPIKVDTGLPSFALTKPLPETFQVDPRTGLYISGNTIRGSQYSWSRHSQIEDMSSHTSPSAAVAAIPLKHTLSKPHSPGNRILQSPVSHLHPADNTSSSRPPLCCTLSSLYVPKEFNKCTSNCTCNRPPQVILCSACGLLSEGHIRLICPVHPQQLYLMDMQCCPSCMSPKLREICNAKIQ